MLLAIEVADTSLDYDLRRKVAIYAAYGVREVWVINARTLATRVFRALGAEGYDRVADAPHTDAIASVLVPEISMRLADFGLTPSSDD